MRTDLYTLNPNQKAVLANASQRAQGIQAEADKAVAIYKELVAMAMPEGANGFDPQTATFFFEDQPEQTQPSGAAQALELMRDREAEDVVDLVREADPDTEYEGSEDNARIEGQDVKADEQDE